MSLEFNTLADANLIESIREHARWQEPCEWIEADGVLLVAGCTALPVSYWNCVARTDSSVPADEVLAAARRFFGERGRKFNAFIRSGVDDDLNALLQAKGFELRSDSPCMIVDEPLAEPALPQGVRVEQFAEPRHIEDAAEVLADAYSVFGLPPAETKALFSQADRLLSPRVTGYIAYRDDKPASTAMTIFSGESAGLYWVGTAQHAQRSGLGEVCTRLATNAGFARGARVVTLQASPYGEPVYRRLGYRTYGRLHWYRATSATMAA